jgi:hypothetical protein
MGDRLDAGARRRRLGIAADREKEGPRQQGQALQRRRTTAPSDLGHYRWMVYLSARDKARLYNAGLREALRANDVYAPVREALGRFSQDDLLNRQLYADLCSVSRRRHPREG